MTDQTTYFLLVHRASPPGLEIVTFEDERSAAAAYSRREHELRDDAGAEVVLVGADSLETVRLTHSHYFAEAGDVVADVERELAAAAIVP